MFLRGSSLLLFDVKEPGLANAKPLLASPIVCGPYDWRAPRTRERVRARLHMRTRESTKRSKRPQENPRKLKTITTTKQLRRTRTSGKQWQCNEGPSMLGSGCIYLFGCVLLILFSCFCFFAVSFQHPMFGIQCPLLVLVSSIGFLPYGLLPP